MTHNQIDYAKHKENVRHNKRSEKQTDRSIAENVRHNKKTEQLSRANIDLGYANVGLGYSNLAELYRHNAQTEVISQQQVDESIRHNTATEQNQADANTVKLVSNPKGYLLYQANKYAPNILSGVVNGYSTLGNSIKEGVKASVVPKLQQFGSEVIRGGIK